MPSVSAVTGSQSTAAAAIGKPHSASLRRCIVLPSSRGRAARRCSVPAVAAQGLLSRLLSRQPSQQGGSAAVSAARQRLLEQLGSSRPDKSIISDACDELMAAEVPFREADLGGGPFQAVYTRGPLLWALTAQRGGRVASGNKASQDFDPQTRRVVNRGELLGPQLSVSASGSYEPADASSRCPKLVRASIEGGSLQAWGLEIPLPIRGSGLVYVAYLDKSMRIFRATNGSISVQLRQQELPQLLSRQ